MSNESNSVTVAASDMQKLRKALMEHSIEPRIMQLSSRKGLTIYEFIVPKTDILTLKELCNDLDVAVIVQTPHKGIK